jgi:F-type H+-transporting ATPase subunit c
MGTELAPSFRIGAGVGIGSVFGSFRLAVARNPQLLRVLFRYAVLGFALTEAIALFGLMTAFLNPLRLLVPRELLGNKGFTEALLGPTRPLGQCFFPRPPPFPQLLQDPSGLRGFSPPRSPEPDQPLSLGPLKPLVG